MWKGTLDTYHERKWTSFFFIEKAVEWYHNIKTSHRNKMYNVSFSHGISWKEVNFQPPWRRSLSFMPVCWFNKRDMAKGETRRGKNESCTWLEANQTRVVYNHFLQIIFSAFSTNISSSKINLYCKYHVVKRG